MWTQKRWVEDITGRPIRVVITEPSDAGLLRPVKMSGRIHRVHTLTSKDGRSYELAILLLDEPLRWLGRETQVISIVLRSSSGDLSELVTKTSIPVNVAAEPEWVLE